jgi:hypothetical protein
MFRTCRLTKLPSKRPKSWNAPNLPIFEKYRKTSIEHASRMQSERWIRFKAGNGTLESQLVIGSAKQGHLKVCTMSSQIPPMRRDPSPLGLVLGGREDTCEGVIYEGLHIGVWEA